MKSNYYILFFFLVISFDINAQVPPYFSSNIYGSPLQDELLNGITKINQLYFTTSINATPTTYWTLDVSYIDDNSNIVLAKNYSLLNKSIVIPTQKAIVQSVDTSIYISGTEVDTKYHGSLWKLKKNLDTLWHKEITNSTPDSSLQFGGCVLLNDGILVYGMSNQYDAYGDSFMMKVDFNGNEIWRNVIKTPNQIGSYTKIIQTKDTCFVALQRIVYPNTDSDFKLIKFDKSFNLLWQVKYTTPFYDYDGDVIETMDSNYVICNGYTTLMQGGVMGTPKSKATLLKVNKNNGSVLWQKYYGTINNFKNLVKVQEIKDGDLLTIGHDVTAYVGPKPQGAFITFIVKTDANGDSLDYKTVFSDSSSTENRLLDFAQCNDGGYFYVGGVPDLTGPFNEQNWLIKSDSNLCFEINCPLLNDLNGKVSQGVISVYPNPTNSVININDEKNEFQNSFIEITNTLGEIVFLEPFKNRNDLSFLPSGMYFLTIRYNSNRRVYKIVKQ